MAITVRKQPTFTGVANNTNIFQLTSDSSSNAQYRVVGDVFCNTKQQLDEWGCKYHELSVGVKPPYDLLICDKTKRIEEI